MLRADIITSPRLAGGVKRYHTWPTLREQTVADHTFHVLRLYVAIFGDPSPEVTKAIINHDLPEIVTGDPPFPVKAENPDLKAVYNDLDINALLGLQLTDTKVSPDEVVKIKICDLVEMHEFGQVELNMGNKFAIPVINDTITAALRLAEKFDHSDALTKYAGRTTDSWRGGTYETR